MAYLRVRGNVRNYYILSESQGKVRIRRKLRGNVRMYDILSEGRGKVRIRRNVRRDGGLSESERKSENEKECEEKRYLI